MTVAYRGLHEPPKLKVESDGNRTYTVKHLVFVSDGLGAAAAYNCPGLPPPGSFYAFEGDVDNSAFCQMECEVDALDAAKGERSNEYIVTQTFTTKATGRCADAKFDDPLREPPKITWSYNTKSVEATHDMYGLRILSSSHEMLRGKENEWDESTPTLSIEQNVASFAEAYTIPAMLNDSVNALPFYNLPPRTVKLKNKGGSQKFHGQCYAYYTRSLEFEVNYRTWDRYLLDEGRLALRGRWDGDIWRLIPNAQGQLPDPLNPADFVQYKDKHGENTTTLLNGYGIPVGAKVAATQFGQICPMYVCIQDTINGITPRNEGIPPLLRAPDRGHDLFDTDFWIPTDGQTTAWERSTTHFRLPNDVQLDLWRRDDLDTLLRNAVYVRKAYKTGRIVTHNNKTYVALIPSQDIEPGTAEARGFWLDLTSGAFSQGVFSRSNDYALGALVTGCAEDILVTSVSSRFVAKYVGAVWTLLNLPLIV